MSCLQSDSRLSKRIAEAAVNQEFGADGAILLGMSIWYPCAK